MVAEEYCIIWILISLKYTHTHTQVYMEHEWKHGANSSHDCMSLETAFRSGGRAL